jgi:hypothetical protein
MLRVLELRKIKLMYTQRVRLRKYHVQTLCTNKQSEADTRRQIAIYPGTTMAGKNTFFLNLKADFKTVEKSGKEKKNYSGPAMCTYTQFNKEVIRRSGISW